MTSVFIVAGICPAKIVLEDNGSFAGTGARLVLAPAPHRSTALTKFTYRDFARSPVAVLASAGDRESGFGES
jgi:hypothetical protein